MTLRLSFALAALAALSSGTAQAQTPCVGGTAGAYDCEGVNLLSHVPRATFGNGLNAAVWGWTDPDTGREYAVVGNETGTAFVDVTEPTAPVYLGKLPTETFPTIWREMRVFANHVFSVSDGAGDHGMQVMDLTRLRDVTSPPVTFTPDHVYNGAPGHFIGSVHTIDIDQSTGIAFLLGSDDCSGGPHMVDVNDPLNPVFQGCFEEDGYSHDALCVLYEGPDADHFGKNICVGFQGRFGSDSHIVIADVTDPTNPTLISRGFYPNAVYTHQGWFTEDFRYMLVDDEIDDDASPTWRTIVFDMTDLDDPTFDFIHFGSLEVTDHNLYIRGQFAYESNYEGGLRILDLSGIDGGVLTEVGSFDTYPQGNGESYSGQWGNYPFFASGNLLANDRENGLFVLRADVLNPAAEPPPTPTAAAVLSAPTPNPAGAQAALALTVAEPAEVVAEVLDLQGRRVALLYEGAASPAAPVTLSVDTGALPAGLYLVRVTGPRFTATRRLSVVR